MIRCRTLVLALVSLLLTNRSAPAGIFSIVGTPDTSHTTSRPVAATVNTSERHATSIGILEGASLIGLEHEQLISDRVGVQFGAGLLGADIGLDFHLAPGIRTSHLNVSYWNVGLTQNSFTAGIVGASYVMRTRGVFTMQLGMGTVVACGRHSPARTGETSLLYSIGICPR